MSTAGRFTRLAAAAAVAVTVLAVAVMAQNVGALTDKRDGQVYKTVKIGKQVWMGQNLNYAATGSACYGNEEANCAKHGRLYNWEMAKTACPVGWHLPSDAEWTMLENAVGGSHTAGEKLKSTSGWNSNGNGTDSYGFSALPGGRGYGGFFGYAGLSGYWWSATEYDAGSAYYRNMNFNRENVHRYDFDKAGQFSVRCVQD